jgi:hypothetical protein
MEISNEQVLKELEKSRRNSFGFFPIESFSRLSEKICEKNLNWRNLRPGENEDVDFLIFDLAEREGAQRGLEGILDNLEPYFPFLDFWSDVDNALKYIRRPIDMIYALGKEKAYAKSSNEFVRRLGFVIFLKADLKNKDNVRQIEKILKDDSSYTVQMAEGWLISEIVIKNPAEGLMLIERSKLSYEVLGKGISKSLDSYRVEEKIKQELRSVREAIRSRS